MSSRMQSVLLAALLPVVLPAVCRAQEAKKQIKVLRVGSSSFPYMLIENKQTILEEYQITGLTKRSSPLLAAYQNEHHLDEAELVKAWKVYMDIWSDPDVMDKLRDNNYPLKVILEVDREFAKRIAE